MTVASCASTVKKKRAPNGQGSHEAKKEENKCRRGQLVASRERATSSEAGHRRSYFGQKCACPRLAERNTEGALHRRRIVSKEDLAHQAVVFRSIIL
eukprot:scaffold14293_cov100-Skeletonema_dohrnii-CCMP3373.AAC.3